MFLNSVFQNEMIRSGQERGSKNENSHFPFRKTDPVRIKNRISFYKKKESENYQVLFLIRKNLYQNPKIYLLN